MTCSSSLSTTQRANTAPAPKGRRIFGSGALLRCPGLPSLPRRPAFPCVPQSRNAVACPEKRQFATGEQGMACRYDAGAWTRRRTGVRDGDSARTCAPGIRSILRAGVSAKPDVRLSPDPGQCPVRRLQVGAARSAVAKCRRVSRKAAICDGGARRGRAGATGSKAWARGHDAGARTRRGTGCATGTLRGGVRPASALFFVPVSRPSRTRELLPTPANVPSGAFRSVPHVPQSRNAVASPEKRQFATGERSGRRRRAMGERRGAARGRRRWVTGDVRGSTARAVRRRGAETAATCGGARRGQCGGRRGPHSTMVRMPRLSRRDV